MGLCNTTLDRNGDGKADAVLFNIVSLNGVSAAGSPVALAQITWAAVDTVAGAVTATLGVEVPAPSQIPTRFHPSHGRERADHDCGPAGRTATPTATRTPTATVTPKMRRISLPMVSVPRGTGRADGHADRYAEGHTDNHADGHAHGHADGDPKGHFDDDADSHADGLDCVCVRGVVHGGSQPGTRRQAVLSDRPVADWRMIVKGTIVGELTKETAQSAVAEALEGTQVRIEALFEGQWIMACESVVACPSGNIRHRL